VFCRECVTSVVVFASSKEADDYRKKYDDDVVGARRLECGGAKQVASSLREAPEWLIATATQSLGGLTTEAVVEQLTVYIVLFQSKPRLRSNTIHIPLHR
jgi:hypothetical protein